MARLKVRSGGSEIEIDSRDFYVDNHTVGEVIDLVATHLPEAVGGSTQNSRGSDALDVLEEAEVHEAEFDPVPIKHSEIRNKIGTLQNSTFFEEPRTASEIVAQLRERGWAVSLLDASKELARMSTERMIGVDSRDKRNYYTALHAPLAH